MGHIAVLGRGVYAEILLERDRDPSTEDELGNPSSSSRRSEHALRVVKAVYARADGHDTHRLPHNIVLEVGILKSVQHDNIVQLLDYSFDPNTSLHRLTLPLLAFTLADLYEIINDTRHDLDDPTASTNTAGTETNTERLIDLARSIASQALQALSHLHKNNIAHRDINPRNIMFDHNGILKLIDLSTAYAPAGTHSFPSLATAPSEKADEMVCQVGTGPYRAPELLFGPETYDAKAIDIWSLGVFLVQLLTADPTKPAFDCSWGDIGLAGSIFRVLGHPQFSWPTFENLPDAPKITFDPFPPQRLSTLLTRITSHPLVEQTADFLGGMVRLDPGRRMTAREALGHPWLFGAGESTRSATRKNDREQHGEERDEAEVGDGGMMPLDLLELALRRADDRLAGLLRPDID